MTFTPPGAAGLRSSGRTRCRSGGRGTNVCHLSELPHWLTRETRWVTRTASIQLGAALIGLLPARRRAPKIDFEADGTSTILHVVESLGVPRTEIGIIRVGDRETDRSYVPRPDDRIYISPVARPQPLASERFVLDVHLGALVRRMRLLGLDAVYRNDASDDQLVDRAIADDRVLLTRDRGILCRRRLPVGAYVRSDHADEQLADVLDRFAPTLAPWTRCVACNGMLEPIEVGEIAHDLMPGTLRTYESFARCRCCHRPYWRGAHADRLQAVVDAAVASQS